MRGNGSSETWEDTVARHSTLQVGMRNSGSWMSSVPSLCWSGFSQMSSQNEVVGLNFTDFSVVINFIGARSINWYTDLCVWLTKVVASWKQSKLTQNIFSLEQRCSNYLDHKHLSKQFTSRLSVHVHPHTHIHPHTSLSCAHAVSFQKQNPPLVHVIDFDIFLLYFILIWLIKLVLCP